MYELVDSMIDAVKRDSYLPAVQNDFTPAQFCQVIDEVVTAFVVPNLLSVNQGYLRELKTTPILSGVASYGIPGGSAYNDFEQVLLYQPSPVGYQPLTRIDTADLQNISLNQNGTPVYFAPESDRITLYPTPDAVTANGYQLGWWYYREPSPACSVNACGLVTAVNTGTGVVTYVQGAGATYQGYNTFFQINTLGSVVNFGTNPVDIYQATSPFVRVATNINPSGAPVNASATTATQQFVAADITNVTPGCLVMPYTGGNGAYFSQSCLIGVPKSITPYVKKLVVAHANRTQTDSEALNNEIQTASEAMMNALRITGNRVKNQPKRLTLMNNPLVRSTVFGSRWWKT